MMQRRKFLIGASIAGGGALLPLGSAGWAAQTRAPGSKRLIVVMLRGAADALNIVVPYGEQAYYDARPTLAIARPGSENGALKLDGDFGLHPALSALMPFWQSKTLAFVHACGSPDPTRSHFDGQMFLENGTPGIKTTSEGWLARMLGVMVTRDARAQAVSLGATLPLILQGGPPVANVPLALNSLHGGPLDKPSVAAAFDSLYQGDDPVSRAYREAKAVRAEVIADVAAEPRDAETRMADNGAQPPGGFASMGAQLARLMAGDDTMRLVFLAFGGWDTHVAQGGANGRLATNLRLLGNGLASLANGLGPALEDTVILVASEFGRRLHENVSGGTDHGHGSVMWVLGGPVQGGKVYGAWPGLAAKQLFDGLDLAVTTDFRAVASTVAERHLALNDRDLAQIFPQAPVAGAPLAKLIAA